MDPDLRRILDKVCNNKLDIQEIPFCWFVSHLDTEQQLDTHQQKIFFTTFFPRCMEGNLALNI